MRFEINLAMIIFEPWEQIYVSGLFKLQDDRIQIPC